MLAGGAFAAAAPLSRIYCPFRMQLHFIKTNKLFLYFIRRAHEFYTHTLIHMNINGGEIYDCFMLLLVKIKNNYWNTAG